MGHTHRCQLALKKKKNQVKSRSLESRTPNSVRIRQSGRTGNRGVTAPLESSREISLARKILSNSEIIGIYTFFEASRFGCHKTIFDATKITYNTYSCAISGMSREMMKMDGRDSA